MSDRAALLAAICAHPDEDTPRLVYADYLDEHGDPKRAARIRDQIALHRRAATDDARRVVNNLLNTKYESEIDRVDWAAVEADFGGLRAALQADAKRAKLTEKAEGVPRAKGLRYIAGERGFLEQLAVADADTFLRHAAAIFRAAPVVEVTFEGAFTADHAAALVADGHLARLRTLRFRASPDPAALGALGQHPDAAGVRRLDLSHVDNGGAVVAALAEGPRWTGLERLDLCSTAEGDGATGDDRLAALFARPHLRGLRTLDAWSCGAGDRTAAAVVKHLTELRELDLALNDINDPAPFAKTKKLPHLRVLDLSACNMSHTDPAALINSPHLPHLTVLRLDGNFQTGLDVKALAKKGRGPTLRALDLGNTHLSPGGLEALARCPAVSGVWHLSLTSTSLTDEHVERFARAATLDRLACLNLAINLFKSRGAKSLAEWPGAASLQWLDVSSNAIGEGGAKALAASPHLGNLKYLHADGRDVAAVLKKRFKKVFA